MSGSGGARCELSGPEHYPPLSLRFGSRRIICKSAVQQAARYNTTQRKPYFSRHLPASQCSYAFKPPPPPSQAKREKKEIIQPKHKSYRERKTKYKTSVSDVVLIVALDAIFHCTPCRKLHTPPPPPLHPSVATLYLPLLFSGGLIVTVNIVIVPEQLQPNGCIHLLHFFSACANILVVASNNLNSLPSSPSTLGLTALRRSHTFQSQSFLLSSPGPQVQHQNVDYSGKYKLAIGPILPPFSKLTPFIPFLSLVFPWLSSLLPSSSLYATLV